MRIVVCVKQVPDTWSEKRLDPSDQTLDRAAAEGVIDELDTYAVEAALRLKEASAGENTVVVLTMGPPPADGVPARGGCVTNATSSPRARAHSPSWNGSSAFAA